MSLPSATEDSATAASAAAPPRESAHSLAHGASWVVFGRCAGLAGTTLIALAVPRCLSQADCGRFWFAQSLIGLASLLAAAGLPLAVIKLTGEALAQRDIERLHGVLRAASLVLAIGSPLVALVCLAGYLAGAGRLLALDLPVAGVAAGVAGAILLSWQLVLVETTRGLGAVRWASLFAGGQSGGPIAALLFAGGLLLASSAATTTATAALILHAVCLAATMPLVLIGLTAAKRGAERELHSAARGRGEPISALAVLAASLPILLTQLLAFTTLSADLILAGTFFPQEQVALLGQSRRLLLLLQLPSQMAVMAVLPAIARLLAGGDLAGMQSLARRAATWSGLAVLPAAAALLAAGGPVMALLFGESYRAAAPLLMALVLGQAIAVQGGLAGYVLLMAGRQRAVVLANSATALGMLVLGPLAAWWFGLLGLTIVAASVLALQSLFEWWLARRLLGVWTHFDWRLLLGGRLFAAESGSTKALPDA